MKLRKYIYAFNLLKSIRNAYAANEKVGSVFFISFSKHTVKKSSENERKIEINNPYLLKMGN